MNKIKRTDAQNLKSLKKKFDLYKSDYKFIDCDYILNDLAKIKQNEIAIDPDINIDGIKNPLMFIMIGMSTRRILDAVIKSGKRNSPVLNFLMVSTMALSKASAETKGGGTLFSIDC